MIDRLYDQSKTNNFSSCNIKTNKQVNGMNNTSDNNNVFSMPATIGKVCIETQNLFSDPNSCFL